MNVIGFDLGKAWIKYWEVPTTMTMNLRIINENTEEGFQDLEFSIVDYKRDEHSNHIIKALGICNNEVVGFEVVFKPDMLPGVVHGELDKNAFCPGGIQIRSIGMESDVFIEKLSGLYELANDKKEMKDTIILTSFALQGDPRAFANEYLKFKVFYDDQDELGLYSELYININLQTRILELNEKDTRYRGNLLKAFSK
ncbi:hypothetical protein [Paenibacillus sp. OAS669]|uniref:hypothetical protein n=1 Tax=Paenibacillus sp. OAS669 TaxID=2663821 RepID=UPI00178A4392|nr:hypothetical protein [Paenibacillus sp. OAS669]MBE1441248.1 hypothetical protein [Paenibacillus sp. OAS669]